MDLASRCIKFSALQAFRMPCEWLIWKGIKSIFWSRSEVVVSVSSIWQTQQRAIGESWTWWSTSSSRHTTLHTLICRGSILQRRLCAVSTNVLEDHSLQLGSGEEWHYIGRENAYRQSTRCGLYSTVVRIDAGMLERILEHHFECMMTQQDDKTTKYTFSHPKRRKRDQFQRLGLWKFSGDVEI